jgi:streptomycin 6-kinase
MKKLWKPIPENHSFPSIADWSLAIQRYKNKFGNNGPLPIEYVVKAEELFAELISSTKEGKLIHGDLHHDNILMAQREPWLAIDPKGLIADPVYETAAMIRNPNQSELIKKDNLEEILKKRILILSQELNFDPQRILKWGVTQTILSAVWTIEDNGSGWESSIALAEVLSKIKI